MKSSHIIFTGAPFVIAMTLAPDDPVWKIPVVILAAGWIVLTIRSLFREGKELTRKTKEQLIRKRNLELEKELGFEPLNLNDLSDEEINRMHAEWKGAKEK